MSTRWPLFARPIGERAAATMTASGMTPPVKHQGTHCASLRLKAQCYRRTACPTSSATASRSDADAQSVRRRLMRLCSAANARLSCPPASLGHMFRPFSRTLVRLVSAVSLAVLPVASQAHAEPDAAATSDCDLQSAQGKIQHMIWLQFDNVHFTRDNPNVPSDLEQMPHLLNFIESNGTLLSNHHTPLIAHTAGDIITTLTGVYPDRHGIAISNSYRYFKPDGTSGPASAFTYWTNPLLDFSLKPGQTATDTSFNLLTANAKNAPAPWVPFTRAGCDVGAVGTANIELENTSVDVTSVFGAGSPEAAEVSNAANIPCGFGNNPPCTPAQQKAKNQPSADFVGIAVHCGKGQTECASAIGARPDLLSDEPGGYNGFKALFGAKHTDPFIAPSGPVQDLNGNVI